MADTRIKELCNLKDFVKNHTPNPAVYELLSEECIELAFWAAKAARIMREEVPTPLHLFDVMKNIDEEFGDVINLAHVAGVRQPDLDNRLDKMKRWKERIEKMEEENNE